LRERDVHAIGRCAVDGVDLVVDALEPQRPAKRQRMANRARFGLRRDDHHAADGREGRGKGLNSRREVSVVIRDENRRHRSMIVYENLSHCRCEVRGARCEVREDPDFELLPLSF
jgi:hypothetical protein